MYAVLSSNTMEIVVQEVPLEPALCLLSLKGPSF